MNQSGLGAKGTFLDLLSFKLWVSFYTLALSSVFFGVLIKNNALNCRWKP